MWSCIARRILRGYSGSIAGCGILPGVVSIILVVCCTFCEGGRWERGLARPGCVRSRRLRSTKHPAGSCGTVRARHLAQHCGMNGKYSTCLLRHRRVVVSQRWNHIASFLRLALAQNSGTVFTVHPATLYQFALACSQQLKVPLGFAPVFVQQDAKCF